MKFDDPDSLERGLHDLVALTTLTTVWIGKQPQEIVKSLSDVLLTTLRFDLVYIHLKQPSEAVPFELVQTSQQLLLGEQAQHIGETIASQIEVSSSRTTFSVTDPFNDGMLEITTLPLGPAGVTGFVVVGVSPSHSLSELDRLLLSVAANQAFTALHQAQLIADLSAVNQLKDVSFAQEQAAREREAGLQSITAAFSQALTVEQVARVVVEHTVNTLEATRGIFHVLVENDAASTVQYHTGESEFSEGEIQWQRHPIDPTPPVIKVVRSQLPLWSKSQQAGKEQQCQRSDENGIVQEARAILPLIINGVCLGAIEYVFPCTQHFSQEAQDFMLAIANQCAQALERARLYEAELEARELLQNRVKLQSVIAELGQEALISFDLPSLMHRSTLLLTQTLDVEYAKVLELIPNENSLLLRDGVGWKEGYVGRAKVSAGLESQAGYTLISHHPVVVEDLSTETRFSGPALLTDHGVVSGMSVIIEGYKQPWGILGVHSTQQRVFTPDDVYFVQSVANIIGATLESARLDTVLETQRQWLTDILDTVPGIIWENQHEDESEEMKLVFISAYVETMLGYTVEEALNERHFWFKIFHPEDAQKTADAFYKVRQSRGSGVVNFRAVRKDGRVIDIQALMTTILKNGQPVGKRGVMMDVSERQQLINAQARYASMLRRSNEDLQHFAYIASHDLQEPLRMVSSYMQLLENRYADKLDEDAREFINFAVEGAVHMKHLINGLLAYSRIDRDEQGFEEFDMQLALDKALANLAVQIEDSGVHITYDVMPRIRADQLQMTQLFQNLLGNAIKFRREHSPEIHFGVSRKNAEWQFTVHDNGIGIEPEALDRIFVIFQRLNKKEEYPGTGIGLAICKKVVERHGGRIWVESTAGQGSTFYFTIPI
ncbi:MAG: GAF domain-containing protein [Anaerolineae bacterium]|nr:GAF domain-containing protein [Anaerolineae bacterium]